MRIKKSSAYLYDILKTLTTSDIEAIKLSSKVLGAPFTEIIFYINKLDNGLLYISIPIRGGGSKIIDPKTREYLFAGYIIDFDTHLKKFMSGERTPNFN